MIESIGQFVLDTWSNLPFFIEYPLWLLFNVVLVRGIIAKKITHYIDEKGWFDHYVFDPVKGFVARQKELYREELAKARQVTL